MPISLGAYWNMGLNYVCMCYLQFICHRSRGFTKTYKMLPCQTDVPFCNKLNSVLVTI